MLRSTTDCHIYSIGLTVIITQAVYGSLSMSFGKFLSSFVSINSIYVINSLLCTLVARCINRSKKVTVQYSINGKQCIIMYGWSTYIRSWMLKPSGSNQLFSEFSKLSFRVFITTLNSMSCLWSVFQFNILFMARLMV